MNIREAILKAADHIERNPVAFYFGSYSRPEIGCGSPGCALGWVAAFGGAGIRNGTYSNIYTAEDFLGIPHANKHGHGSAEFYYRMSEFGYGWQSNAEICASHLRKYADLYHPSEKKEKGIIRRTGIPAEVLAWFDDKRVLSFSFSEAE